jgi:hypothetical protein
MPLPNTLGVMQGIQSLINGLSPNPYKTVALEAFKDWTNADPVCEIAFSEDDCVHFAAGGTIRDIQGFRITSAVLFAGASTAVTPTQAITTLCTCRDAVVPLFQQHAYLGGTQGVSDSRVKPGSMKLSVVTDEGNDYLVHEFVVEVESQYTVPIGVNGV